MAILDATIPGVDCVEQLKQGVFSKRIGLLKRIRRAALDGSLKRSLACIHGHVSHGAIESSALA
jgi:hypothetical protein